MKQNRNIEDLKPGFRERFANAMKDYNERYPEAKIFVVETLRSLDRQRLLVKEGKSKTMKSNHLTGMAVDIAFAKPLALYPSNEKLWENLCVVMRRYGIVNGYYDLMRHKAKNPIVDKPHFQAVEMQKPVVPNEGYNKALRWKNAIKALRNIYQAKINRACLISQKAQLLWYEKVKRFEELLKN